MTEIKIKMYRILGYDENGIPYDITRCLNIDTEQFLNKDIDDIKITKIDKTSSIHITRQDRVDLRKQAKKEQDEENEELKRLEEEDKPTKPEFISHEAILGEHTT